MLNTLPKEMKGYLPSEVAYQVKRETLYIYLRVVKFYLSEQRYELLNKVDAIQIPVQLLKEQFNKKMNEFIETIYPYGMKYNHYQSAPKQYRVGNLLFKFEFHQVLHQRGIKFEIAYSLGPQESVVLAEGVYHLNNNRMNITSKNVVLKRDLLNELINL